MSHSFSKIAHTHSREKRKGEEVFKVRFFHGVINKKSFRTYVLHVQRKALFLLESKKYMNLGLIRHLKQDNVRFIECFTSVPGFDDFYYPHRQKGFLFLRHRSAHTNPN